MNYKLNLIQNLIMKHVASIFVLGLFILIGFGSYDEETGFGDSGDGIVLYIDTDTDEGLQALGSISLMSFSEMTEKYGDPSYFYDGGDYFMGRFSQIKMKKKGTNFWCTPEFRYNSSDGSFQSGKWSLSRCKPK